MAKKISSKDIFQGDLFARQITQAEALLKAIREISGELKEVAKVMKKRVASKKTFDSADEIAKVEQQIKKVNDVTLQNLQLKKQEAAANTKLIALQKDRNNSLAKSKIKIAELNKVQKQSAREALGLVGAYEKESKRLIRLRKDFKNLAVAGRENGKVARGLKKEITALDSKLKKIDATVGQNQRSVGNYSEAFKGAIQTSGVFSRQLFVLQGIQTALKSITKGNTVATEADTVAKVSNASATRTISMPP